MKYTLILATALAPPCLLLIDLFSWEGENCKNYFLIIMHDEIRTRREVKPEKVKTAKTTFAVDPSEVTVSPFYRAGN